MKSARGAYLDDRGRSSQLEPFSFFADATIALGLAACDIFKNNEPSENEITGMDHFAKIMETTFVGTSGSIQFSNLTGTRNPTSAFFSLNNHVVDLDASSTSEIHFRQVLSDIYQNGEWRQLQEYIFNDGTSNIPPDLPPINVDYNHLSSWLRILGFCLASLVVLMAAGFAVWTYKHQGTSELGERRTHITSASWFSTNHHFFPSSIKIRVLLRLRNPYFC